MPTAYTAEVATGAIKTFPEFAMLCAREFGALIEMRDLPMSAPIPEAFQPSPYHRDAVEMARADPCRDRAAGPRQAGAHAMTPREQWLALAARCEAATGPDRLLDLAIHNALTGERVVALCQEAVSESIVNVTDSIDAITALIEWELPSIGVESRRYPSGKSEAYIWGEMTPNTRSTVEGIASIEALARCAAFLRAKAEGA